MLDDKECVTGRRRLSYNEKFGVLCRQNMAWYQLLLNFALWTESFFTVQVRLDNMSMIRNKSSANKA